MFILSIFLAAAFSNYNQPFTETFGPDGEVKVIDQSYVSCAGRTFVQTRNAMEDLMMANTDREAKHAIETNKCSFIAFSGDQHIRKVLDRRCVNHIKTPDRQYCKDEYYIFELENAGGQRYLAIYSPEYD